ncbi:MAG: hypothetical protein SPH68_06615 [Candidatus Borkfalkiaceae bacterium]|nr:hypothetical protein [Clostridia bacterium]MDY6223810.1 hypothetical protein [Christensenellaceae bacterium]
MEKTLLVVVVYHTARALSTFSQKFSGPYLAFFSLSRDIFGAARGGCAEEPVCGIVRRYRSAVSFKVYP